VMRGGCPCMQTNLRAQLGFCRAAAPHMMCRHVFWSVRQKGGTYQSLGYRLLCRDTVQVFACVDSNGPRAEVS
jgi:hypothetical protein